MSARAVGRWQVPIPDGFEAIESADALQFTDGKRVMYVSTMDVGGWSGRPFAGRDIRRA